MSLMSFPRQYVIYDVDNSCDPAKMTLTFTHPDKTPNAHNIDSRPDPKLTKLTRRRRGMAVKPQRKPPPGSSNPPPRKAGLGSVTQAEDPDNEFYAQKNIQILSKKEMLKKRKEEFQDKGVKLALLGEIEKKVKCACMSTDHLLGIKRTKLRELLLAEEVAYTSEYVAMCQQTNANREEEVRRKAVELKERQERENKEYVEHQLLLQKIEKCDEARLVLTQKRLKEVKEDQLWQIKAKYVQEEVKREEDRMYHDMMMKNILAMKQDDEEQAKMEVFKKKEAQEAFIEQMKWKEQKLEAEKKMKELEKKQIEEDLMKFNQENFLDKEGRLKKKAEMKKEVQELLARERALKEKRRREEELIDQTFLKLMKIEEEIQKQKERSSKEKIKREMNLFLSSIKEVKRHREEEDRKIDQIINEFNEKRNRERDLERKKLAAAREELFRDVLRGREQQLYEKQQRQKLEEERERRELELIRLQLEQQNKIREEYENICAEKKEEYKQFLIQQIKDCEAAKKRKKEEEYASFVQSTEQEDKEIDRLKGLLTSMSVGANEHPMKKIIQGFPPKYDCPRPCPN